MAYSALLFSATVALTLYILGRVFLARKQPTGPPLPPGPKPLPLIGNATDLPPKDAVEWKHWLQHKELYGPISSVTVLGSTLVIINDKQAAIELMEKRAAKHSNRPFMEFAFGMSGFDRFTSSQQNDNTLRRYRKLIHTQLGSTASLAKFERVLEAEVGRFLLRTLEKPEDLTKHIQTEAGAIILDITYGYTLEPQKRDPLVTLAERMMQNFSLATQPGVWPVDLAPFLKHLPDGLPGTGFKRTARSWSRTNDHLTDKPYDFVRAQIANGTNKPSFIASLIMESMEKGGKADPSPEDEHAIKAVGASMYAGGADTSVSSIMAFFLAMTMYPEVQRKAKEEIKSVVGSDRLPTFKDREDLPYINAIVKETLRWQPVAPLALPHATAEDDVYEGYLIPKDAILVPNVWWFMHDPDVYPDPDSYQPERFLEPRNEPSPENVFGFGRRVCPGRRLADTSIFLTIAQTLAVFDIKRAVNENGQEIPTSLESTGGIITHPKPWAYSIVPRSEKHAELIRKVEVEHPWEEGDSKYLADMEEYIV